MAGASVDRIDVSGTPRETIPRVAQTTLVDEIAFRSFYDRTACALRAYLRMLTRDVALADDLLQESYLRLLRAKLGTANEFQMKAYLYKSAVSAARDHWRVGKRARSWQEEIPAESVPADRLNLSYDVNGLFRKLDPRQQALLWLAYVEGFGHHEIGEIMGLREKSVRVVLLRARRQFAGMLNRAGFGPKEQL